MHFLWLSSETFPSMWENLNRRKCPVSKHERVYFHDFNTSLVNQFKSRLTFNFISTLTNLNAGCGDKHVAARIAQNGLKRKTKILFQFQSSLRLENWEKEKIGKESTIEFCIISLKINARVRWKLWCKNVNRFNLVGECKFIDDVF